MIARSTMPNVSRRSFVQTTATLAAATLLRPSRLLAAPFGLPLGLQLYSVRDLLPKDYAGTLKQVSALGYKEVEAAGFFDHPVAEVKQAMSAAGLHCVSGHYPWDKLSANLDNIITFHKQLGAEYIICAYPGHINTPLVGTRPPFSLADWHWNADNFNRIGKQIKAAGLRFGYHNHTPEFVTTDGVVPYDELLRLTDPALVTFEMDCGWVAVSGADPIKYLHQHADRISMLHVKDFQSLTATPPHSVPLGQGVVDLHAILAAADKTRIKHYFVEQEQFAGPPIPELKIDADYMQHLTL